MKAGSSVKSTFYLNAAKVWQTKLIKFKDAIVS